MHMACTLSLLLVCILGIWTWKISTCTWLDVAEFLTKEPPTGKNTGKVLRAAVL